MLLVQADFQPAFQRLGLSSCDSVVRHFTDQPASAKVTVRSAELVLPDGSKEAVFYKQYDYTPPAWKFIGRSSKARCEFENYAVFARLGIACATPIACGEERGNLGRLRRAFIITRAIPEAVTLKDFVQQRCANRADHTDRRARASLLRQLADMTRRIHTASFFHHDLVWRNIVVTGSPPAGLKLWWIDCPRGGFDRWSPLRHRRRLRDLASLDKLASELCSKNERLWFVKFYLGKTRLDISTRKLVHDVLEYRRTHWPDDWK